MSSDTGSITFNQIPNNIRLPFMTAEFDSSNAIRGAQYQPYTTLILGQKLPSGKAPEGVPVRVNGERDAVEYFGYGSMLADMVTTYRLNDPVTELWVIAVPDDPAGQKATAEIAIAGEVSTPGTIFGYIAGKRFTVAARSGDTREMLAPRIAAAINELGGAPVVAYPGSDKVTLEALHPGEVGNDLDFRFNFYTGEYLPEGIDVTSTAFSGGTSNPDVTGAIGAMSGSWYNGIINPYLDANNLYIINQELDRRWGPLVMQEGWQFGAKRGTHGQLGAFGSDRNSKHEVIMHCHGIPTSPWSVAAALGAVAMYYGNIDPARPFQTLPLLGVLPPKKEDIFSSFPESNQLLYDGISTFTVDGDQVRAGRLITTYKLNERGADDVAYLDLNTGMTLGYIRWDWRNHMLRRFPRHKLGNDGINYSRGQAIVTPLTAKAECVVKARDWEGRGLVENVDLFKKELLVLRNASDVNRLDFLMRPDLMNQFIVGAAQIQFYL